MKQLVVFAFVLLILSVGAQQCKVTREIPCNELGSSSLPGSSQKGEKGDLGLPGKAGPKGSKGNVGRRGQQGETGLMVNMDHFVQEMKTLVQDLNTTFTNQLNEMKANLSKVAAQLKELTHLNCSTFDSDGILITKSGEKLLCSQGWTVFQRRLDGQIADFHRKTWEEYANGFGEVDGEFWFGLRKLHQITSRGGCKLRVDLWSWDNETAYAEYSQFSVDSEANMFRLQIGGYSGTAGNSIDHAGNSGNGRGFTTVDRDNDNFSSKNCASLNYGGWWLNSCGAANLNAIYSPSSGKLSAIIWYDWKALNSLKSTMLKVRCD